MNVQKLKNCPGLIYSARDLDISDLPRVDCHLHTSWTDGEASVKEVYDIAATRALKTILFSEHSRKTSIDWFPGFHDQVRALPSIPCRAYVGTEVKVESIEGDIDTCHAITERCDFVMASVHRFVDNHGEAIPFTSTDRSKAVDLEFNLSRAVLSNPQVDILGHMFGMSYRRFNICPPDDKIRSLICIAAEYGVAIEVNSSYHPNCRQLITWCQEFDAQITFGSNAHSLNEVGAVVEHLRRAYSEA
jgi:putative hydrolase